MARLLIADTAGAELYEIDPDGADSQGTLLRDLPSGLILPFSMTNFNGRLLITDDDGAELYEIDPDGADSQGTLLRDLPSGLTGPLAMTNFNGRLLITDDDDNELYEIDPDGADSQGTRLRALPSGLTLPGGMTNFNGRLLIADNGGGAIDELYEIDPDGADSQGTLLRDLPSGLTGPLAMTNFNGRLLIADTVGAELYEIDPDGADSQGTLLRDLPSGLTRPFAMTNYFLPSGAPSWTDDTGDTLTGTAGTAITPVTIPTVDAGASATTYAASDLPSGISFDASTRELSGTPNTAGSGTVTITATNSGGSATYSQPYDFAAAPVAPSWTDDTGDTLTGTAGTAITPVTIPTVDAGASATTYAASDLPSGISFDASTRELSGTPNTAGSGTVTITATNSGGSATYSQPYDFAAAPVAPSWTDDTGDTLTGTAGTAITPVTIPTVDAGASATTYAASDLPSGISFDASTRELSGTPNTAGSGTVTITATNSGGSATYSQPYDFAAAPVAPGGVASRLLIADTAGAELYEIDPDGADSQGTLLRDLPSGLILPFSMTNFNGRLLITDDDGAELYEIDPDGADSQGTLLRDLPSGLTGPLAMTNFNGRLLITDDDDNELYEIDPDGADSQGTRLRALPSGLTLPGGMTNFNGRLLIADNGGGAIDELYEIDPDGADSQGTLLRDLPSGLTGPLAMTNFNGRLLIADTVGAELYEIDPDGADSQGTLLRDLPSGLTRPFAMTNYFLPSGAPSWTDDTGDTLTGTAGTAITPVTIPTVDAGASATTYAASDLPSGISFDASTRELSGTPNTAGSGTVTITATNSGGSATYSQPYDFAAAPVAPSWTDDTGDTLTGTAGTAITPVTIPTVDAGASATTYAASDLPSGISFDASTRELSGTPNTAGSGTVTITATNSGGSATYSQPYDFAAAPVAPSWTDDTGDTLTGTAGTAITPVTIPTVDAGASATTYAASDLPSGISFDASTRELSGTPNTAGSGTVTITATNSGGSATYSQPYDFAAAPVAPSWTDDTGDTLTGTAGTAITPVTIPTVDAGASATTYAASDLPSGISFDASTRELSGTPNTAGSGTVTITATNSGGSATYSQPYDFAAAPVAPGGVASRLLIADTAGAELYEIDPDGADSQGTLLRDLPSGLILPFSMTNFNGRLLITDDDGAELYEIDPDGADSQGTLLRDLPSGLTGPLAMTNFNGRLLITDDDDNELYEIDPDGADSQGTRLRALPSGLTLPGGMTNFNGRLLIADNGGGAIDELYEIDPDGADSQGTLLRDLPSGLTGPLAMTNFNGRLLIADTVGAELYEIDPDGADSQGTLLRDLPSGLTRPFAMTNYFLPSGAPGGVAYGGTKVVGGAWGATKVVGGAYSDTKFSFASATPTGPATPVTYRFDSLAAFENVFTAESTIDVWTYGRRGTTSSPDTGPSNDNVIPFVYTETSRRSNDEVSSLTRTIMNAAAFALWPRTTGRVLYLDATLQGQYGDGELEGLEISYRTVAGGDTWLRQSFIYGTPWAKIRAAGSTFTDAAGVEQTVIRNGGWVGYAVLIPDTAVALRLQNIVVGFRGRTFRHDISLAGMELRNP